MPNKLRKVAGIFASGAVGVSLLGGGVYATMNDSATATDSVNVNKLACTVTSADPNAQVSQDGKSVTITEPAITSSTSGNYFASDVTVHNTGSIPELVHWTFSYSPDPSTSPGNTLWQPGGLMGFATGTTANNMTTDIILQSGDSHVYGGGSNGVGYMWATLTNQYLGQPFSATMTANCSEPPASSISYVGSNSIAVAGGTAKKASSTACPTGSPASGMYPWVSTNTAMFCGNGTFPVGATSGWPSTGSFTVAASGGTATLAYTGLTATSFTGVTNTSSATGSVTPGSNNVTQVLPSTNLPVPSGAAVGDYAIVVDTGNSTAALPSGLTAVLGTTSAYGKTAAGYEKLTASDISNGFTVPANTGTAIGIDVYHGVKAVDYLGEAGASGIMSCPDAQNPPGLHVTTGSSWVVCAIGSSSSGLNSGLFAGFTARGASNTQIAFADSGKGLATFSGLGPYNGQPGSIGNFGVELESN